MVIKKMNSVFHKHSRWLFGVFTVIIILSFVGFLTPGNFGFGGLSSPLDKTVGTAYGEKISYARVIERMRALSVLRMIFGGQEVNETTAFFSLCLDVKAAKLGIAVEDGELVSTLKSAPLFQKDGKYDPESYKNMLALLRANGMNEEDLLSGVRASLLQQKLTAVLAEYITVTDSEVRDCYRRQNTLFTGKIYTFKPVEDKTPVPTADAEKYFRENAARYMIDGNARALLVFFPFDAYRDAAKKTEKDAAKIDEKSKELALAAANDFACEVYDALKNEPSAGQLAAFQKMAKAGKKELKEFKFVFGTDKRALKAGELALLNASDPVPVSDAFVRDKNAVVGFVAERVDPRPAQFQEAMKKVYADMKTARTRAATVKSVLEFSQKYAKCATDAEREAMLKKAPVDKTVEVKFSEAGEAPAPENMLCADAMISLSAGEAAPVGDRLAVLQKRTAPDMTKLTEKELESSRVFCRRQKWMLNCYQLEDDIYANCVYRGIGEGPVRP